MNAPMIDFRTCSGLQPDVTQYFLPNVGVVFSCEAHLSDPPDVVIWHNFLDEDVRLEVIDVPMLFRRAPDEIVEVLFLRQFEDAHGNLMRMAEPCLDTGHTLFRGASCNHALSPRAADAVTYLHKNASQFAATVTLRGGEEIAVDNRRQMVRFLTGHPVERNYVYTTHLGEDHPAHEKEPDHARI